jgi:hypothetical protein
MADRPESIVLFLGAGASRPFGIPMTAEILPAILNRLESEALFTEPGSATPEAARDARAELHDGLMRLVPGLFRKGLEPPLITDLLSLVDQLLVSGNAAAPDLGVPALDRMRALLEQATAEVLSRPAPEEGAEENRPLLAALVDWIHGVAETGRPRLTLISTNYDVVLEERLFRLVDSSRFHDAIDFGLSWRNAAEPEIAHPQPAAPRLRIYKLHGSLDWLRCSLCDHVYIEPARTIFREGGVLEGAGARRCACGFGPLRHLIVAPSMVRDIRDPNLLAIWQSALEALRTADAWTVIGYSMPPEDVAIRSMLVRAYAGRRTPPRVSVVDCGPNPDVEHRYRLLFPDLVFEESGVEGFVRGLAGAAP